MSISLRSFKRCVTWGAKAQMLPPCTEILRQEEEDDDGKRGAIE